MFAKILVSIGLFGGVFGFPTPENQPIYGPGPAINIHEDPYQKRHHFKEEKRPYTFDYGVKDDYTGANFGHQEDSDGEVIKGSYTVALPDGRIQRVTYTADHYNGFQAEVSYEGEATYPEYKPHQPTQYAAPHQPTQYAAPHHPSPYKQQPKYTALQPSYAVSPRFKEEPTIPAEEEGFPEYS